MISDLCSSSSKSYTPKTNSLARWLVSLSRAINKWVWPGAWPQKHLGHCVSLASFVAFSSPSLSPISGGAQWRWHNSQGGGELYLRWARKLPVDFVLIGSTTLVCLHLCTQRFQSSSPTHIPAYKTQIGRSAENEVLACQKFYKVPNLALEPQPSLIFFFFRLKWILQPSISGALMTRLFTGGWWHTVALE